MFLTNENQQKRSVLGLLITQFFGAFNDNAWKVMVFTLATRPLMSQVADGTLDSFETSSQLIATLSLVIFLIPMMLFSLPAGAIADQMSKSTVIVLTKILEVIIMGACAVSLYLAPTQLLLPFILLGLMGLQSAFFGPAKYGIIPEILPPEKLSKGNGDLEMWTMIAIIAGTALGPVFLAADNDGQNTSMTWTGPLWLAVMSCIGLIGALFICRVPVARVKRQKVSAALRGAFSTIRTDRVLKLAVLGSTLYWTMISLIGQNILVYAKKLVMDFEKGELLQGIPPACYGLGIALGALLGGRFSGTRIEYGFIPLGAIGFAICSLLLGIIEPSMAGTIVILIFMGMSSGLLIVPLHAIVQSRAPNEERGSIIALGNFLDIAGMTLGSLVAGGMAFLGFGLKSMLISSAFLAIAATIWCVRILPKALVRLSFIILTRTIYKLRIKDLENLPKEGPILLVANHVSIIDALFVMASINRPVRFIMNEYYYKKWFIYPVAKLMDVIPVSSTSSTRVLLQGMRKAGEALDNGEVVCIFPEGQISHTGKILPFRRGIELICKGRDCPIVPIHLDNVWGSIFSYDKGRFFKKWPQQFPYSLTISFGKPQLANATLIELRSAVQEMEYQAWNSRREKQSPIHHQFISNMKRNPFRLALADKDRQLKGWETLTGAIALSRVLQPRWTGQKNIGILLPTCIPSALINLATTLSGRTAVNLNFTAGKEAMESAIRQAELKMLITSRLFIEKGKCALPEGIEIIYAEDLIEQINASKKFFALFIGLFAPISTIEKYCGSEKEIDVNDTLTIIFTSGSTGEPKGVVLSHFNISSNVESVSQVLPHLGKKKNLLASLPFFHSFGYMLMWLGFNHKIGLITQANPLEFKAVGELVKKYNIKFMMTTPTFLQGYIKQIVPNQFGSLECIITGAEKLTARTAEAFESHFGIRPIEGYGTTECSPVIATSTLDVRLT
nr:MFS transporter [Parachlamydiaceae bacterium]